MSLRVRPVRLLTQLAVVLLCDVQLATAESLAPFEYKGLLGHMTIEQARGHDGHTLTCETDGPKPYEHMEWTLADGELVLDEWIARFNPADQRFATVLGLKFLPTALAKRRAEAAWIRHRASEERNQADM